MTAPPRWKTTAYWRSLPHWKQVLLDNEDLFILRYFPHKIDELKGFHRTLLKSALYRSRSLVLFPAGHGKTTLISTICPILEMCRNPDIRMTGILKNDKDAEGIGQAIQAELLGNELLIRDFGPFRPDEDNKPFAITKMSIAKRQIRVKEPTLILCGARSRTALGTRSDWTFCDDIVTDETAATPERRAKLKEWFMQGPATQGDRMDARLTVVGTRFDPQDLYGDLIEMIDPETGASIYDIQEFAAILNDETHETLWPEKRPFAWLMLRKVEMGTLDFNKRFLNRAVDASRLVFRQEYIKGEYLNGVKHPGCLDRDYKIGDIAEGWRSVAGFDPAVGGTRSAKFCAHVVLAQASCKEHERCYWVVDLKRDQMTLPQQVETIIAKHQEYGLLKSMIEANSYQQGLFQAVQDKMSENGLALTMEPHYTTRTNKPNPELGVQSMSPWFERGLVHIPWGDAYSQRVMGQLVDELIMYPDSRTTDTVMAFWFAWKELQQSAPRYESYNRLLPQGKPLRPWARRGREVRNPYYDEQVVA